MNPDDPIVKWRTGNATVKVAASQVFLFLEDTPQAQLFASANGNLACAILTPTLARAVAEILNAAADVAADL